MTAPLPPAAPAPRDAGVCRCTFAQRVVGDGCDVCNPALAAEIAAENAAPRDAGVVVDAAAIIELGASAARWTVAGYGTEAPASLDLKRAILAVIDDTSPPLPEAVLTDWPRFLEWLANMRGGRLVLSHFKPERGALPWHAESGYGDDAIAAEGGDVAEALAELARFVTGDGTPRPRRPELTPAIEHVRYSIEELDELIGDDPGSCFVNSIEGRARDALRAALDTLIASAPTTPTRPTRPAAPRAWGDGDAPDAGVGERERWLDEWATRPMTRDGAAGLIAQFWHAVENAVICIPEGYQPTAEEIARSEEAGRVAKAIEQHVIAMLSMPAATADVYEGEGERVSIITERYRALNGTHFAYRMGKADAAALADAVRVALRDVLPLAPAPGAVDAATLARWRADAALALESSDPAWMPDDLANTVPQALLRACDALAAVTP